MYHRLSPLGSLQTDDEVGFYPNGNSTTYLIATSEFEASPDGPIYLLSKITGRMPLTPTGLRYVDTPKAWDIRYC